MNGCSKRRIQTGLKVPSHQQQNLLVIKSFDYIIYMHMTVSWSSILSLISICIFLYFNYYNLPLNLPHPYINLVCLGWIKCSGEVGTNGYPKLEVGGSGGRANNMYYGQSESGDTDGNKFKQRRIKFGPRLKLNCNIYKIICCGLILSLV